MNEFTKCEIVQERLQKLLDGVLPARESRSLQAHLDSCPQCRELAALMRMDLSGSPDLTAAVLARTTGSPCGRAREILCDYVDEGLDTVDRDLLRGHLDRCGDCAATANALEGLAADLPAMASLQPQRGFVADVLAATSARRRPWADAGSRWARTWAALLARPRIAWELGYTGAMALWLFFGTVGAPLWASRPPLPTREKSAQLVGTVQTQVSSLGRQAWSATGGQGLDALQEIQSEFSQRYRSTAAAREDLRLHGKQLTSAAIGLDLEQSGRALVEIKEDARSVVIGLATSPDATESTDE